MLMLDAVNTISSAMVELNVRPHVVEETTQALKDVIEVLGEDAFQHNAVIATNSFGSVDSGTSLSYHHARAQEVMAATLAGIAEDISAFATNVARAASLLQDVDASTAADLKKREAVIDQFSYLTHHSRGEDNYHSSRGDS